MTDITNVNTNQPVKTIAPGIDVHPDHAAFLELLDNAPLHVHHYMAWGLASGGTFLDGMSVFILGIAMPLIQIQMKLSSLELGLLGACLVAGAIIGASLGGRIADLFGRKSVFLLDMLLLSISALFASISWNSWFLIIMQLFIGIAIGMDFPVSGSYIAECMPKQKRGRMMVATITSQSVGMVFASFLVISLLKLWPSMYLWRVFIASESILAVLFLIARMILPESARWLMAKGQNHEAVQSIIYFVPQDRIALQTMASRLDNKQLHASRFTNKVNPPSFKSLFSPAYLRRTLLSTVPWFLMDIATYGIGLFTAVLLFALHVGQNSHTEIEKIQALAWGSGLLDVFLFIGFLFGMWAVVRFGRMRMQMFGFAGMSIGMMILLLSVILSGGAGAHIYLVFGGFVVFNLLMNMGPNSTTFIMPAELFPTRLRATGSGFSAALAKTGATLGVFLLPILKNQFGIRAVLILMIIVSILGLLTTWLFRVDDNERSLEEHQAANLP
ncbi:MAG: MFS transporter [Minisyncoccia bacterium]